MPRLTRTKPKKNQNYSLTQLIEAGIEAQILPELTQQAIQEIQERGTRTQVQQERIKVILITAGLAIALWGMQTYDTFSNAAQVDAAWAQVENQFQRRADLIPIAVPCRL